MISRRSLFLGAAASLLAAPSIVRAASLMPVSTKAIVVPNDMAAWDAAARVVDAHARLAVQREFNVDCIAGRGYLRFIHRTQGGAIAEMNLVMTAANAIQVGVERSNRLMFTAVRQGMIVKTMDLMAAGYVPRIRPLRDDGYPILMGFAPSAPAPLAV